MRGGVSDFTQKLFERLSRNHSVLLMVWHRIGLFTLIRSLRQHRIRVIGFQFTPWMYGFAGLTAVMLCLILKLLRLKVILHVHESYEAWRFDRIRSLIRAAIHRFVSCVCFLVCDRVFFSGQVSLAAHVRKFPFLRTKSIHCPTPSNIDAAQASDLEQRKFLEQCGLLKFSFRFLVFGLPYNLKGRVRFIEAAAEALSHDSEIGIALVGVERSDFPELFDCHPNLIPLGYRPEREVSILLQSCQLMLAPFEAGVSTKHGSVMAAFLHCLPVLTTFGPDTEPEFKDCDLVEGTSYLESAYCEKAQALILNAERRRQIASHAHRFYLSHDSMDCAASLYEKEFASFEKVMR